MKIVDFQVADVKYVFENEISREIGDLNYPQKYIYLCENGKKLNLRIKKVTEDAYYLIIEK